MDTSKPIENAVIACEIKISVTATEFDKVQKLIEQIRKACTGDYKLEVNFSGEFFAPPKCGENCRTFYRNRMACTHDDIKF